MQSSRSDIYWSVAKTLSPAARRQRPGQDAAPDVIAHITLHIAGWCRLGAGCFSWPLDWLVMLMLIIDCHRRSALLWPGDCRLRMTRLSLIARKRWQQVAIGWSVKLAPGSRVSYLPAFSVSATALAASLACSRTDCWTAGLLVLYWWPGGKSKSRKLWPYLW